MIERCLIASVSVLGRSVLVEVPFGESCNKPRFGVPEIGTSTGGEMVVFSPCCASLDLGFKTQTPRLARSAGGEVARLTTIPSGGPESPSSVGLDKWKSGLQVKTSLRCGGKGKIRAKLLKLSLAKLSQPRAGGTHRPKSAFLVSKVPVRNP